uniref:Uncharacterized protein n=1 Tax=Arundo donax TaxID=35708 RepID=A0A0A9DNN4_ARUDO
MRSFRALQGKSDCSCDLQEGLDPCSAPFYSSLKLLRCIPFISCLLHLCMYLWCFDFVFHMYAFILLVPVAAFVMLIYGFTYL